MLNHTAAAVAAIVTGIGLELAVHAVSGRREAWDSPAFWTFGFPCALAVCAVLGRLARERSWLWTAAVVPAQVSTMMVRTAEIGSLWPLAVALSAVLSAPFVLAAFVGSRFRAHGPGAQRRAS